MEKDPEPKKMGRRPKPKGTAMTNVVCARFTDPEHAALEKAAKRKQQSLSAFARSTLLDAARKG